MARLRSAAVTRGPDLVWMVELSSRYTVSRSQCSDSIPQCWRIRVANWAGLARLVGRLVTPSAATADSGVPAGSVT